VFVTIFILLGGWAATASISGAVIAQGMVAIDGKRKPIQHLEGGIVKILSVKDGDNVRAGQVLLELEPVRARAGVGIIEGALSKALASEARLFAERDESRDIAYPTELLTNADWPEFARLVESQNAMFETRRASLKGEVEILEQRIEQIGEERKGLGAQQEAKAHQSRLIAEELDGLRGLLERGQTTKPRVLALERQAAALRGEEGELAASIARLHKNIGETRLEIIQRRKDFQKAVTEEMQRVQAELRDLRERAVAARDMLDRINVTAPVSGIVVNMAVHTVGAVIKPGEIMMEIVPGQNDLIVEVPIRPQDIDNVSVGQDATVRLLAFKQRVTPLLTGRVTYISADSLEDKATRQPYFIAHIAAPKDEIAKLGDLKLVPGMQTEVMIATGHRTAFRYLIQPIVDSMNRAMREE
jgi:HlyD family type I secretion membrane fusion protein